MRRWAAILPSPSADPVTKIRTLDETSAERLFNGATLTWCKIAPRTPNKVVIGLAGFGGLQAKEETFLLPADNNVAIFNESGQEISNLATLVNQILRSPKAT